MKKTIFVVLILLLTSFSSAQTSLGLRVIRVPGCSETPSNFYGVDYPNATSYTRPAGGYLSIKDSLGNEIAIWAPGQWVRVEKINASN